MNAGIQRTRTLELCGQRPSQHSIGARQQLQMQIRLLGDLGAQRVDHHQPAAGTL